MRKSLQPQLPNDPKPVKPLIEASEIEQIINQKEGYLLGRIGHRLIRCKTDTHLVTVAPSGKGKGTSVIIPNLLDHEGSAFVTDIRGETYKSTAEARRYMGQRVVVIDPFNRVEGDIDRDTYNPLDLYYLSPDKGEAYSRLERLANSLMFDPKGRSSDSPIWDLSTQQLLKGLLHLCLDYWPPYKRTIEDIYRFLISIKRDYDIIISDLEGKIESNPDDLILLGLREIMDELNQQGKLAITLNAIRQAGTNLNWIENPNFREATGSSTFSFADMRDKKMTVYLILPGEHIESCATWVRMMLENAVFSQEDITLTTGIPTANLKQEDRVLFLLDEVAQFGELDIVSKGLTKYRGRGINVWLFFQSLGQLIDLYGENTARTILGQAAAYQIFGFKLAQDLKPIVEEIGDEYHDVFSVAESWAHTKGKSVAKNDGITRTETHGTNKQKGTNSQYGRGYGSSWGGSFDLLSGTQKTNSRNWQRQRNRNRSFGTNESEGENFSVAISTQSGTTITENESNTHTLTVTVNRQRMALETVRTIREKFNADQQYLHLDGHHPFFCDRAPFFAKFEDSDQYLFPDMAALADSNGYNEIFGRSVLVEPITFDLSIFETNSGSQSLKVLKAPNEMQNKDTLVLLQDYQRFFTEDIPTIERKFKDLEEQLFIHRADFKEVAAASMGVITAMQKMEVPEFINKDQGLFDRLIRVEEIASNQTTLPSNFFDKFKEIKLVRKSFNPKTLSQSDCQYLVHNFSRNIALVLEDIEKEKQRILSQMHEQEVTRMWLMETFVLMQAKRDEALARTIKKDGDLREAFFMKRLGIND